MLLRGGLVGKYSVPEHIRAMKPKGTMVKAIGGRYYVYEYETVVEDGRRKTRMGSCIGKIKEGIGFVPNSKGEVASSSDAAKPDTADEVARLRARVAELEAALAAISETATRALKGQ